MSKYQEFFLFQEVMGLNKVTLWHGGLLTIRDTIDNEVIVIEENDAIELAKLIIRHRKVPFCNRIKGAGTTQ